MKIGNFGTGRSRVIRRSNNGSRGGSGSGRSWGVHDWLCCLMFAFIPWTIYFIYTEYQTH